jgi:iron(II)-dependent oxidoreductase
MTRRIAWLLVGITVGLASAAAAQQKDVGVRPATPASSAYYGASWALLIGIDQYKDPRIGRLKYAVNDVRAMEATLAAMGFRIITLLNDQATKGNIEAAFQRLGSLGEKDRLVVFFSGHGESVRLPKGSEEGFLIPHDADRSRLVQTGIPMRDIDRLGERLPPKHILFVLDACHSGFGFIGFKDIEPEAKGDAYYVAATQKPVVQVLTAGETGQKAIERDGQGVFTRWLVQGLRGTADRDGDGIITANELAAWVEPQVTRDSRGLQKPVFGRLFGEGQFLFDVPGRQPKVASVPPPPEEPVVEVVPRVGSLLIRSPREAVEVWLGDRRLGEAGPGNDLRLARLGVGPHRLYAKARREGMKRWEREVQVVADQAVEVVIDIEALRPEPPRTEDRAEMVLVPAGEFWMGSDEYPDEKPRHRVYLDAYHIDKYEVTNALYKRFMDPTGRSAPALWTNSNFNGPTQPVVGVDWYDAEAYCRWAGKRLPTEAEWEKAARGTDGRKYPWGHDWDSSKANSREIKIDKTVAVGSYPAGVSPYGAHDMAGNVWEWVADWYDKDYYKRSPDRNPTGPSTGQYKVLRGGAWVNNPINLRTADRSSNTPDGRNNDVGFRCARGSP